MTKALPGGLKINHKNVQEILLNENKAGCCEILKLNCAF